LILVSAIDAIARKEAAWKRLLFLAGSVALATLLLALAGRPAHADSNSIIGFDMAPESSGTASGTGVSTCASVNTGDKFEADVFITNVQSLTSWELRVDYDSSVVSLDSADFNFLLAQNGGQVFPTDFEQEKDGRMFLAAADGQRPNSGSGVLARLHLTALANGTSSLKIPTSPTYYGPRLTGAAGAALGDTSGDAIWDGTLTAGTVKVGSSCAGVPPLITPAPVPISSPKTGSSATPQPGGGVSTPTPSSGTGGAPDTNGEGGSGSDTGSSSGSVVATDPASSPAVANVDPVAGNTGSDDSQTGHDSSGQSDNGSAAGQPSSTSDGSSTSLIIAIAAIVSGLSILAGASLLLFKSPWAR
jgi:hypothetical protein